MRNSCLVLMVALLVQPACSYIVRSLENALSSTGNSESDRRVEARNHALINEILRVLKEDVAKLRGGLTWSEGMVRLAHGKKTSEGVAQMYRNGQWGNICDIGFANDGWPQVICLELGYPSALNSKYVGANADPWVADYPISLESPACRPDNADSMAECGQDDNPACNNDKAVYVECEPMVRLDGPCAAQGAAQMYTDGAWGSICDKEFNENGWPSVLCVELGYTGAESARYAETREKNNSIPIAFPAPNCNLATADRMAQCGNDNTNCGHGKDVYVTCTTEEDRVRLDSRDSSDSNIGVAMIYRNGKWGTICDTQFYNHGWPQVFCNDLGYAGAESSEYVGADYKTTLPISYMSPACDTGNAATMADCGFDTNPACDHSQDVLVTCQNN